MTRKVLLCLFLMLAPLIVFAKHQALHYGDNTWTVYLNEEKSLVVIGPWGDVPALVDRLVDDFWASVNGYGPIVVYLKYDDVYWQMLKGDTGDEAAHGILLETDPDVGYVDWVAVTPIHDGARVKVALDSGQYYVYKINRHGWYHLIKQGAFHVKQP